MHITFRSERLQKVVAHPVWALVAAFGTYFCMYGFRKPYTAGTYNDLSLWGLNYKLLLIIAQTIGYVLAKWVGIKVVSEIKPKQRILAILGLILFAEAMLFLFGIVPAPWNAGCLFLNGLPLGVIFGLVLGVLEGRNNTEVLVAGLCASFIVSDGVSKSVGAMLLQAGITQAWMPFFAGLVFIGPTLIFITMLACVPVPTADDITKRSARDPMTAGDRWHFFNKYAPGIIGITLIYLFVTLLRSIRADFAVELWTSLGYHQTPDLFTRSELLVSFCVIVIIALAVLIRNHKKAFRFSLLINLVGFITLLLAVAGLYWGMEKFTFMVLVGLGVYLPYVAIHAITFERLIAVTREKASVSFLMYIVDSVGYTGYIGLMLMRYFTPVSESILSVFLKSCIMMSVISILIIFFCHFYFKLKFTSNEKRIPKLPARKGSIV